MALWIDKQRPNTLNKLTYHPEITEKLRGLAASEDLPHLLFYGPSGAGKKTRVMALLREMFGPGVEKVKLEHRTFKTTSNKTIDLTTLGSNYHIECNPSDAGQNDRFIVQEVIKEIASHGNVQSASKSFKVVVLAESERLSKQAQAGLRRTMEKFSGHCRLVLICNSISKITPPLRSRCLCIRIPAPEHEQVATAIVNIAKKEQSPCPIELARNISVAADRNLRRALLMAEACKVQHSPLTADQPVPLPDWEIYIGKIAKEIMQEQSPNKLLQVRDMVYELLTNCIPADIIITTLAKELMKQLDDQLKHELIYWAAFYEHRIQMGSKDIFHLEAFIAKFMSIYKRWIISIFG